MLSPFWIVASFCLQKPIASKTQKTFLVRSPQENHVEKTYAGISLFPVFFLMFSSRVHPNTRPHNFFLFFYFVYMHSNPIYVFLLFL